MASPVKNLVDATGISFPAFSNKVYTKKIGISTLPYVTYATVRIELNVPRFTLSTFVTPLRQYTLVRSFKATFSSARTTLFSTFPSGYHESSKQRPTEGLIFPRKRIKNY
jgi:hypothetical protein